MGFNSGFKGLMSGGSLPLGGKDDPNSPFNTTLVLRITKDKTPPSYMSLCYVRGKPYLSFQLTFSFFFILYSHNLKS